MRVDAHRLVVHRASPRLPSIGRSTEGALPTTGSACVACCLAAGRRDVLPVALLGVGRRLSATWPALPAVLRQAEAAGDGRPRHRHRLGFDRQVLGVQTVKAAESFLSGERSNAGEPPRKISLPLQTNGADPLPGPRHDVQNLNLPTPTCYSRPMAQRTRLLGSFAGYRWRLNWPPKLPDLARTVLFYAAIAGAGWLVFS